MRLIDSDRLLSDKMKSKYYHLPNGDVAIPIVDIEHAPTVGGWISVKDRMPETQDWYLVFAPTYSGGSSTSREHHRGVMFAKWSGKSWSIERCYYNRPDCVKAWMPLPEPPKGGEVG